MTSLGNEPKPIFVTGATGSIGYMLAKRLSENGSPVRALARDLSRARNLNSLAGVEVVAGDTRTCRPVGRVENGPHFRHREMTDELLIMTLARDGMDSCNLLQRARAFELHVAHERFDCRESQVSGRWAISAILLDMSQEHEDHLSVNLLEHQLRWPHSQSLSGKREQQLDAMRIALTTQRTCA